MTKHSLENLGSQCRPWWNIFQGVWKISVASVVDDKAIFRVVLNVSVASDEITFHVFFNIDVVDVVVMKLFYMYSQKST